MNQPSDIIPNDAYTIPPSSSSVGTTIPNSPLTNLLARLRKSERSRKNTSGAFGGKARSARHQGRF